MVIAGWVGTWTGVAQGESSQGTSVLLIGDSHTVGTFGGTLDTLLRGGPNVVRVKTVGSCGKTSGAYLGGSRTYCGLKVYETDWTDRTRSSAPTPKIDDLLEEVRPDLTIIAMGANEVPLMSTEANRARAKEHMSRLLDRITASGSKCLWVGPPAGRNKSPAAYAAVYETILSVVDGRCDFFDSRPDLIPELDFAAISRQTGIRGDGAHYDSLGSRGRQALRKWALGVYTEARKIMESPGY